MLLASQSPRRKELLTQLGVSFHTLNVDIDETQTPNELSITYVARMAVEKATEGMQRQPSSTAVLGADTIVVPGDSKTEVLGKPTSYEHAVEMWQRLSGTTHHVYTAVAIVTPSNKFDCVVATQVTFKSLSNAEMRWYWQTGEPVDKAGGYGIQGLAGQFVTYMKGSYSSVVGLPLYETSELLKQAGIIQYER